MATRSTRPAKSADREMESIMKNLVLAAAAARAPFRWTKTADEPLPASDASAFAPRAKQHRMKATSEPEH
jgi:hypothetical protein